MIVDVGRKLTDFSVLTDDNAWVSMSSYWQRGYVVLYFYPKDNTTGCTKESCEFKEYHNEFNTLNCTIIGVSRDSVSSHVRFKTKYALPFDLLADEDEKICSLFATLKEKSMYGRKYLGIERSTFIIDPQGVVQGVWRNVKVPGHVLQVLNMVASLAHKQKEEKPC